MAKLPQIPGYISFDELEGYCDEHMSSIDKGMVLQKERNVGLKLAEGGKIDTTQIEMRGEKYSWMKLKELIASWRQLDQAEK